MKYFTVVLLLVCLHSGGSWAEPNEKPVRVALITGGHGFEEKPFLAVFSGMKGMDVKHIALTPQNGFISKDDAKRFDAAVLYNMSSKITEAQRESLWAWLDAGKGLVFLHHAIADYPEWPEFEQILGAKYFLKAQDWHGEARAQSEYTHDVDFPVHIEDPAHPITQGLTDFTIHDEVYRKWALLPDNHLLLTTTNELSDKALAWTRLCRKTNVVFIQLGHGPEAYANPSFSKLVERATLWSAGRLDAGAAEKK